MYTAVLWMLAELIACRTMACRTDDPAVVSLPLLIDWSATILPYSSSSCCRHDLWRVERCETQVLRALGATDQQLTTRMITVHNKVDLLQPRSSNGSEADIGGDSDGDDDLPVADSSCTTPGNSEHTQEAAAATELASSTLLTAANSSDSHPHRQQPQLLRANRYAEAIRNGEGYGPGRPTHICLEAPLLVSVVTEQGLLQLLQEVDRKVRCIPHAAAPCQLTAEAPACGAV